MARLVLAGIEKREPMEDAEKELTADWWGTRCGMGWCGVRGGGFNRQQV